MRTCSAYPFCIGDAYPVASLILRICKQTTHKLLYVTGNPGPKIDALGGASVVQQIGTGTREDLNKVLRDVDLVGCHHGTAEARHRRRLPQRQGWDGQPQAAPARNAEPNRLAMRSRHMRAQRSTYDTTKQQTDVKSKNNHKEHM